MVWIAMLASAGLSTPRPLRSHTGLPMTVGASPAVQCVPPARSGYFRSPWNLQKPCPSQVTGAVQRLWSVFGSVQITLFVKC